MEYVFREPKKAELDPCPRCGCKIWRIWDSQSYYSEACDECAYRNVIRYQDLADNFMCEKCGCISCEVEQNKKGIMTKCNQCNDRKLIKLKQEALFIDEMQLPKNDPNYVDPDDRCKYCGGTQFTPVRKKFGLLTGFATNKVELICNKCGKKKR